MGTKIPVVVQADFRSSKARIRGRAIATFGEALQNFGFARVRVEGLKEPLEEAYAALRAAAALSHDVKMRAYREGMDRGYKYLGVEHARDNQDRPDLKEFWHVGREVAEKSPLYPLFERNVWLDEVPEFRRTMLGLYHLLEEWMLDQLGAIEAHLDLPIHDLVAFGLNGNHVLRAIHYPPLDACTRPGSVRSSQHEDINLLTLLPAASDAGLELLTRDGTWMAVDAESGLEVIVDTGDMMKFLTNGFIPSTTHRVVNPADPTRARLSLPFFGHARPDAELRVFERFATARTPPPIIARDFLRQRLIEIGVIK